MYGLLEESEGDEENPGDEMSNEMRRIANAGECMRKEMP